MSAILLSACRGSLDLGRNLDAGVDAATDCTSGLVCAGRCLGGGWELERHEVALAKETLEAHAADLDADGYPDAVFHDQYSETLTVYWGGPSVGLVEPTVVPLGRVISPSGTGDIDGDGVADYIVATERLGPPNSSHISIMFGSRDRDLTRFSHRVQAGNPRAVALADVTGDGRLDILATLPGMACVALLVGLPDGLFEDGVCAFAAPSAIDDGGELLPLGDGSLLVWSLGSLTRMRLDSAGAILTSETLAARSSEALAIPSVFDLDRDGRRDVLLSHLHFGFEYGVDAGPTTHVLEARFAESDGGFTSCSFGDVPVPTTLPGYPSPGSIPRFSDLDGDRLPDGLFASTCGLCSSVHGRVRRTP